MASTSRSAGITPCGPPPDDDVAQELEGAGDGARGIVHGIRVAADGTPSPGHVFNAVNRDGTVHFVDGQVNGYAYLENYSGYEFMRTN